MEGEHSGLGTEGHPETYFMLARTLTVKKRREAYPGTWREWKRA